jgi:two-component system, LytTR family, sensor histidine kinase AlgZ
MQASIGTGFVAPAAHAPAWRKALLVALAVWSLVALLAAVADYRDALRAGTPAPFSGKLAMYGLVFLPFSLLSAVLAAAFERAPHYWLRPRKLGLGYALTIALFLPVYGLYEVAALTALAGQPLPGLVDMLLSPVAFNRFLDGLMITLAFTAQASYSYWLRGRRQERAAHDARRANLSMRLALLQGQLEPYFLLSSLDGIGELVRNAERVLATRALARLSDLLRYALRSSQQDWLSVADEIGFMRDYLELQALRFGERLQVRWQLGDVDWAAHACPALLLHPLAEQAVAQGMQGHGGHCVLGIALALEDGMVVLRVERSRAGAPAAAVPLEATAERLQLLYGERARLDYLTTSTSARVTLAFPARGVDDD